MVKYLPNLLDPLPCSMLTGSCLADCDWRQIGVFFDLDVKLSKLVVLIVVAESQEGPTT